MILAEEAFVIGPLYVDWLQKVGEIEYAEFSFAIYGDGYDNYIDFGRPIESRICTEEENCQKT